MTVAEMQACLARLYLSEAYRQWFYADATKALASYRLAATERDALVHLHHDDLELFAGSLIAKRRKGPEGYFPASFALDAAAMRALYHRYHQLFPPRSDRSPADDALAFGRFAETSLREDEQAIPYAADVMRYECLYHQARVQSAPSLDAVESSHPERLATDSRPARRANVELAHFGHDVAAVEDCLRRGEPPPDATTVRDACSILFVPDRNGWEARMMRINAATLAVVECCDGRRTVADVVAAAEEAIGAGDLWEPITGTIERLVSADVLLVDPGEESEPARPVYAVASQSEGM